MTVLLWRLHRRQLVIASAALAIVAVILLVTGTRMSNDYHAGLSSCAALHNCSNLPGELFQGDGLIIDLVSLTVVVPLLFGLFWGVPLVAKEIEEGTQFLVWTQTVTRRRWMVSSVEGVLVIAVLWGTTMSALVTWWRFPENALQSGRFGVAFDISGIAPIAYSLFAVALGVAAGALLRRVLPAFAVTLTVFAVARVSVGLWLRPRFLPPLSATFPLVNDVSGAPPGAWILSKVVVTPYGAVYNPGSPSGLPSYCRAAFFENEALSCLADHGFRRLVVFQPAARFWAFQGIEAAFFVALAIALLAVALRAVTCRDA